MKYIYLKDPAYSSDLRNTVFDHTYMYMQAEDSQHVHKKTTVESIDTVMSDNLTYFRRSTVSSCACTIYTVTCTVAC